MKKLVMFLALAVAFSLSGFAQTSSGSTGKKASMSSTDSSAKSAKGSSVTGCLKSDATPVTIANGKYKDGVQVDTSADTTDDFAKHNGHKVQLMGSWEGTGTDKKFKATSMKHIAATCTVGEKSSAAGEKKGKKAASDTSKTPS